MKDNFDDYIKGKLNQRHFEFDEANWLKAANLLDQEDKDKRRGFFWFRYAAAALLLFTLVGIGWYFTNSNNIGLSPKTVVNTKEEIPSHNHFEDQQKLSETSNETLNDLNERKTEPKTVLQPSMATNQKNVNSRNLNSLKKQPTFTNRQYTLFEKPTVTNYDAFEQNTRKNNPVLLPKTQTISKEIVKTESILINALSTRLDLFNLPTFGLDSKYLDESVLKHTPEISAHPNKLQFALRAGILDIPKTFKNMSYSGGIVMTYPLSNRWAINLEGNYVNQFYTFDAVKTAKRITYTFGKNISDDALTPDRLHRIEIPLYLSFRFGKHPYKNQINFGVSMARLLASTGKIISNSNETQTVLDEGKIVTDAFNTNPIYGILGYEYRLNKRLNIGLRGTYQFSNLGNPSYKDENFLKNINDLSKFRVELGTKIRLY